LTVTSNYVTLPIETEKRRVDMDDITKTRFVEYEVRPIDKHGDVIDVEFYDTKEDARADKADLIERYGRDARSWIFERTTTKFRDDGEMISQVSMVMTW